MRRIGIVKLKIEIEKK